MADHQVPVTEQEVCTCSYSFGVKVEKESVLIVVRDCRALILHAR
jgi:hypothetical protein